MTLSVLTERRVYSPPGYNGGDNGLRGRNILKYADGRKINLGSKNTVLVVMGVSDILGDVLLFVRVRSLVHLFIWIVNIFYRKSIDKFKERDLFEIMSYFPHLWTCSISRDLRNLQNRTISYKNFVSSFGNYHLSRSNCFLCNSLEIN